MNDVFHRQAGGFDDGFDVFQALFGLGGDAFGHIVFGIAHALPGDIQIIFDQDAGAVGANRFRSIDGDNDFAFLRLNQHAEKQKDTDQQGCLFHSGADYKKSGGRCVARAVNLDRNSDKGYGLTIFS